MSEPHVLRDLPAHLALVRELARLDFEFDTGPARLARRFVIRGFTADSVVEVNVGPPLSVTLLFSAEADQPSLIRSSLSLVALASVLRLDFTDWLASEIRRRGHAAQWRSSRRFAGGQVSAEHLGRDAMLLSIEADGVGLGRA